MKYKKILLFFGVTLPLSVLLRTLEIFFTVEPSTASGVFICSNSFRLSSTGRSRKQLREKRVENI